MKTTYELTFPCYCCGKEVKASKQHHIVTADGRDWLSHEAFVAAVGNLNPTNPEALASAGYKWRPEVFGASCYARVMKEQKAKGSKVVVIKGDKDGLKYAFIKEVVA